MTPTPTPQTRRKRTRRKSPSMSSTEPSNANEDECIRTEPETPGTSQPNTTGTQELTDREEL
ncbi:hypothetical protein H4Q26_007846, partial [Puccinia striiformis f. sp. tritici PST-130]